ncbi:tRNA 5-methylaminomethyl-2-thiouridine biosynthesis bifunctional protein MnmC [Enhygromyxa salina]|uniref:D-amino-acid oxidase n=1 Tax=Enhygromyxa salina TaxID=215803 RepID=A0A2S9XEM4_9BACT|nr:FAD-dependent oxidoreductase [Enhygromyxa salina]PRP91297.1 tRNA 5-methylaminomethyl-2-thiouridine biosynthesis bifunctional protein MnmC [Enhygromyxa salina]
MSTPEIIIIGGGVSGLSCASELATAGRRVQVWTAAPPHQTTSAVAAAFWYPYRVDPIERVGPWAAASYERFATIAGNLALGPTAGVYMREALEVFVERVPDPPWSRYVDMFRHAVPEELPAGYEHGLVFESPVIDMPRYLPWLVAGLERLGVEIVPQARPLDSLAPALERAQVVVNTTGLGARELVGDSRLYAVRGQTLRRERGELSRVIIDEHGPHGISYVIPRGDDVVLGGVADERDEDLELRPEQSAAIFERCARLEPGLVDNKPLGASVGLRPCRDEVRLEQEERDGQLIVHDYGHGGAGVTLSWGCAEEVRDRVQSWLQARRGG